MGREINHSEENRWKGLFNLGIVYVVWGSTYLAIRVAVKEDGGFAPFILGFMRVIVSGILLIFWGILRGVRIIPSRQETITLIISGILLWVGGNGLVNWAEQRISSSLAALIISATLIWVALIESIIDWKLPSLGLIGALLTGFGGIAVLTLPTVSSGASADIWSVIGLLLAGLSWGGGSVFQSRRPVALNSAINAGYQNLVGAIGFGALIYVLGETWSTLSANAWLAWVYLVVFGSLFAFTSYIRAIKFLPMKIVATYAFVNPVIAIFLGWLVLGESVTIWTLSGALLVLIGVAGVFRDRYRRSG